MATISQEFTRYFGWLLKYFGYKPYHIVCEYNIYGNYKTFWERDKNPIH